MNRLAVGNCIDGRVVRTTCARPDGLANATWPTACILVPAGAFVPDAALTAAPAAAPTAAPANGPAEFSAAAPQPRTRLGTTGHSNRAGLARTARAVAGMRSIDRSHRSSSTAMDGTGKCRWVGHAGRAAIRRACADAGYRSNCPASSRVAGPIAMIDTSSARDGARRLAI